MRGSETADSLDLQHCLYSTDSSSSSARDQECPREAFLLSRSISGEHYYALLECQQRHQRGQEIE